jgi:uncharacterized Zn ribbon protein
MKEITETIYVAEDGTRFYTRIACADYELNSLGVEAKDDLFFYDSTGKLLPVDTDFDTVFYIKFNSVKGFCYLKKLFDVDDVWELPEGLDEFEPAEENMPACFYYDSEDDGWKNLKTEINKLKEIERIFTGDKE